MKTIEIEKELDLDDVVELLTMNMKDNFIYRKEASGMRCIGPFYLKGRYTSENEVKDFQDVFEFDIFASNEKLDGEDFKVVYNGYDYVVDKKLILYFYFNIFGVKDDQIENQVEQADITSMNMNTIENAEEIQTKEIKKEHIEEIEDDNILDISVIEELFDEKDSVITSYSFVVVKKGEDYHSIAARFLLDVEALKEANNNKEIYEKSLLVLPYKNHN